MPYSKHWVKHGPFLHEYLLLYIEKLSKAAKCLETGMLTFGQTIIYNPIS